MGSAVNFSKTYHFRIAGQRITLYKKNGESYEHVLMKALGYAMVRPRFSNLEIERRIGLRYRPPSRIRLFNFNPIVLKEAGEDFNHVAESWYEPFDI